MRVPVGRSDMVAAVEVVLTQAGLAVGEPSCVHSRRQTVGFPLSSASFLGAAVVV